MKNFRILTTELEAIKHQMEQLCNLFRAEFGGDGLKNNKLVLKLANCANKKCPYCPHGPYWYRATFNPTARRFIFKYLGSSLKKSMLKGNEMQHWDRLKFYDNEIKRLKKEKQLIIKELKKLEK
jgi:hypothetical protein